MVNLRYFLVNKLAKFQWIEVTLRHNPGVVCCEAVTQQEETEYYVNHIERYQGLILKVS